jgi:hypothetical protein
MIRTKMYRQIQEFKRQGMTKGEIGEELELDPKTVAKYYGMDDAEYKAYRQQHMFRDKALEAFEPDILDIYAKNEYKRLNMAAVYDYLSRGAYFYAVNRRILLRTRLLSDSASWINFSPFCVLGSCH